MSLLRKQKYQRVGNTWDNIVDFFSGRSRKRAKGGQKNRRLLVDPLEERMLLTLAPGNLNEQLVNQTFGSQSTGYYSTNVLPTSSTTTQAVASDHNGDFVVAWTRYDPLLDPVTGLQTTITDPITGLSRNTDANIYARYFTDDVQRITLPSSMLNSGAKIPAFSMLYGGNAVQKISITSSTPPANIATSLPVSGVFRLGFDVNGDGSINPVSEVTTAISYNESTPAASATVIQNALRALGGSLTDVNVQALTATDYQISFGNASNGQGMPTIQVLEPAWQSGFLPTATVTSVRQPSTIGLINDLPHILVSPTDPTQTALSIQSAFSASGITVNVAPVVTASDLQGLVTFDITFVGNFGKSIQPQLAFDRLIDANNTNFSVQSVNALNVDNISILKAPSPEFRVNPPEPDNPYTFGPDQYDQTHPAVSMDADGDFVITWQSEVTYAANPGSQFDIFAARYSPAALIGMPNLVISSTNLSVLEGSSATTKISLDRQPTSNVTVTISPELGGNTDLTTLPQTLTFTPANWNTPQAITISAAVDASVINNGTAKFDVSANGMNTQAITATEMDRQTLIISTDNLSVPEYGSNTFKVRLAYAPVANVTVNITKALGGDASLNLPIDPTTLTFTSANWNTDQ
jgi:hypothetical protein